MAIRDAWRGSDLYLSVRPLAAYFIMGGRIYQSPDVYTLLSNRLVRELPRTVDSRSLLSHAADLPAISANLIGYAPPVSAGIHPQDRFCVADQGGSR